MKSSNTILFVVISIVVTLYSVYFLTAPKPASQEAVLEDLIVGVIIPLDPDLHLSQIKPAYEVAVDEINLQGGTGGRLIKLIFEDGKCNGEAATQAVNKLINIDRVKIILTTCNAETAAAAKITEPAGILLLSPYSTDPSLENLGRLVLLTSPSHESDADLFVSHAVEFGFEKPVVIYEELPEFGEIKDKFTLNFKSRTGNEALGESFKPGQTNFYTTLRRLQRNQADSVVIATSNSASTETILKQLKELKINLPTFITWPSLPEDKSPGNLTPYEGVYISGIDPNLNEATVSVEDTFWMLSEAIDQSGGVDPNMIADYFLNDLVWNGRLGEIKFSATGHAYTDTSLFQIKSGRLEPIELDPVEPPSEPEPEPTLPTI